MQRIALILLTYNAENDIPHLIPAIQQQTLQPDTTLILDSTSTDSTMVLLADYPAAKHIIPAYKFDHGGTRKLATQLVDADIYIYLTQDAYPADEFAFQKLIDHLNSDPQVGCAYGRQLPKADATPLSAHLRLFNYPGKSYVRDINNSKQYGIKTCFNSDSFAAYRKTALEAAGNFPDHIMTAEDMYVAANMQLKGFKIGYAADACVYHSHNFSLKQEFHRYFSIGVFHRKEHWIIDNFKSATGEGMRFIKSEIKYLIKTHQWHWIPRALLSTLTKFTAYKLGWYESWIPHVIKRHMGINKAYWKTAKTVAA